MKKDLKELFIAQLKGKYAYGQQFETKIERLEYFEIVKNCMKITTKENNGIIDFKIDFIESVYLIKDMLNYIIYTLNKEVETTYDLKVKQKKITLIIHFNCNYLSNNEVENCLNELSRTIAMNY
jgi:hypothetical protein